MERGALKHRLSISVLAALLAFAPGAAFAGSVMGSAQVTWKIPPSVKATVTPNYASGFGPTGGLGSGQTPAAGPGAALGSGTVDFGKVVVGYAYLYKYAAQVNVITNDPSGFVVYAEGATDLNGTTNWPLANTLLWLPSASSNNPFSPATTFNKTGGNPIGVNGSGGIDYSGMGGTPPASAIVWNYPTATGGGGQSQGWDYELQLSGAAPLNVLNVYIVYTVIGN